MISDRIFCVDFNECLAGIDQCNKSSSTCTDTDESYVCICNEGYLRITGGDLTRCYEGWFSTVYTHTHNFFNLIN